MALYSFHNIVNNRWSELTRKIELWVEIHELSEQGEYVPVEVMTKPEVPTGGTYQLRQVCILFITSAVLHKMFCIYRCRG